MSQSERVEGHKNMRTASLILLAAACGGTVPNLPESCTTSTCGDAVGTWDAVTNGGQCAQGQIEPITLRRDGGEICIPGTVQLSYPAKTTLTSDGGCGFTLRLDEGQPTGLDVRTDQTWDVKVTG